MGLKVSSNRFRLEDLIEYDTLIVPPNSPVEKMIRTVQAKLKDAVDPEIRQIAQKQFQILRTLDYNDKMYLHSEWAITFRGKPLIVQPLEKFQVRLLPLACTIGLFLLAAFVQKKLLEY